MRITTKAMRENVTGWLKIERANRDQTLQLLDAIYAGAIAGGTYVGVKQDDDATSDLIDKIEAAPDHPPEGEGGERWDPPKECGCLLDTFERIQGGRRPSGTLSGASGRTFALALKIGYGDTPETSPWSRAAARGVEDYYLERGWK